MLSDTPGAPGCTGSRFINALDIMFPSYSDDGNVITLLVKRRIGPDLLSSSRVPVHYVNVYHLFDRGPFLLYLLWNLISVNHTPPNYPSFSRGGVVSI